MSRTYSELLFKNFLLILLGINHFMSMGVRGGGGRAHVHFSKAVFSKLSGSIIHLTNFETDYFPKFFLDRLFILYRFSEAR